MPYRWIAFALAAIACGLIGWGFGELAGNYVGYRKQAIKLAAHIDHVNQYCKCQCKVPPEQ